MRRKIILLVLILAVIFFCAAEIIVSVVRSNHNARMTEILSGTATYGADTFRIQLTARAETQAYP